MLKKNCYLYFPELICVGDATFNYGEEPKRTLPIYKLDWTGKEKAVGKKYETWIKTYHPEIDLSMEDVEEELPSFYGHWINEMQYVISLDYKKEIRRCAERALGEWSLGRPFDTMIRDMCLGPAIEFVNVGFKLLVDCAYDPETNYYYTKSDKLILPHTLLYKFWMNQTGRGMVYFYAGLNHLERLLEMGGSAKKEIKEFLVKIVDQEQIINEKYDKFQRDEEKPKVEK